jgi:hypothetical protein
MPEHSAHLTFSPANRVSMKDLTMFNLIRSFPGRALGTLLGVLIGADVSLAAVPRSFVGMRAGFVPPQFAMPTPIFRMVPPVTPGITPLPNSATLINPAFQIAPGLSLNQYAFNVRVTAQALRQIPPYLLGYNPYGYGMGGYGYGTGGYGYGMGGYGYPMGTGYGGSYPAMMYSGGYGGGSSPPAAMPDYNPAATAKPATGGYGAAYSGRSESKGAKAGVFAGLVKEDGGLDWPLALRILPPGLETKALRDRLDAEVREIQAAEGKSESAPLGEMKRNLDRLTDIWADRAELMLVSEEARIKGKEFIRKLREALKAMQ